MKSKLAMAAISMLALAAAMPLASAAAPGGPDFKAARRFAGPDGGWDYAAFDPVSRRLFVARTDGVFAVDVDSGKVTAHLADASRGHIALPIPGTGDLLTTNSGDDTARIFNAATGALEATIATGKKPDAAAYDAATKQVFVMDGGSGEATIVDPATRKAVGTIMIGGALEFAVTDGQGKLYVNIEDKGEVAVVDTRAGKVLARYPLAGCEEPSGIALTTGGALISACANGVAKVTQASTGKDMATLKIGARPDAVIYDAVRGLAFIPCGGDGTLTIIDAKAATPAVIGSVPTQRGARTGTLDPKTGRIYLPTAQYGAPSAAGQRPSMVPGSFAVLELTPG